MHLGSKVLPGVCRLLQKTLPKLRDHSQATECAEQQGGKAPVEDAAEEAAFQRLKALLIETTVLTYPDPSQQYILDTDASNKTAGLCCHRWWKARSG